MAKIKVNFGEGIQAGGLPRVPVGRGTYQILSVEGSESQAGNKGIRVVVENDDGEFGLTLNLPNDKKPWGKATYNNICVSNLKALLRAIGLPSDQDGVQSIDPDEWIGEFVCILGTAKGDNVNYRFTAAKAVDDSEEEESEEAEAEAEAEEVEEEKPAKKAAPAAAEKKGGNPFAKKR